MKKYVRKQDLQDRPIRELINIIIDNKIWTYKCYNDLDTLTYDALVDIIVDSKQVERVDL